MPDSLSNITNNVPNLPASTPAVDWYYILTLLAIMVLTGLLGGYANYLNAPKEERSLLRSLMMGLVATIAIPLFLKVVDSNILNQTQADVINYFVYAGCCVLAAFYAARFLEGLSSRVLQNLQDKVDRTSEVAQETATKVEENTSKINETAEKTDIIMDTQMPDATIDEVEVLPTLEPEDLGSRSLHTEAIDQRSPQEKIVGAFIKNKQLFHTLETLAKSTGLNTEVVKSALQGLEQNGKLKKVAHRGQDVYSIVK